MEKCSKCNNQIINDNAKFCDDCGEFLVLSSKEIRYKEKIHNNKFLEFKKILIESTHAMSNHSMDSRWYYETIMSYLIDLTNIGAVFKRNGLSFIDIGSILISLEGCSDDLIVYEFLVKVSESFEFEKKSYNKESYNVIIYTNINDKLKEDSNFNEILKFFNLAIFDFNEYVFDEDQNEVYNDFDLGLSMFKFTNETRDLELLKSHALNEIYSLFGYLTYLNKFNKTTEKYYVNELALNNQVSDFECNALILAKDNNEILDFWLQDEIITNSKNLSKSKINKIQSNGLIKDFNDSIKKKISGNIKYYFQLYYLAAAESSLENSFLKFWSVSEKIIKDIYGDVTDSRLKKIMENILKAYHFPKSLIKRIDFIHLKRNDLVHENKHGDITQYDQTLIKVLSERLIEFLINYLDEIEYMEDYGVILDYVNRGTDEKRRLISLIELTIVDSDE